MSRPESSTGSDSSSWQRFEALLEEYAERVRRGDVPSPDSFADEHPEHAQSLRSVLGGLASVESAASAGRPDTPERLGEYRIVREIGRGGMGVVFEALQESLGRRVALKTLPRLSERHRERFRREAQAAAGLDHAGIVAVHAFGEHEGRPWCAMQLVDGCGLDRVLASLRARRERKSVDEESASASSVARWLQSGTSAEPSPETSKPSQHADVPERGEADTYWRRVAGLGLQVAEALSYAHTHGVLHRDVKPSNLLIDTSCRVRVADFGLCKLVESETLSATGEVLGTLRYMAAEQLQGNADVRTDVHGLGLVLYELLTLRPAYAAHDRSELLGQLLYGSPTRPRRMDRTIPLDLERIVLKAIAKLPEERYGTAAALADDLRRFLEGRSIAARPPSAVYLARLALRRWRIPVTLIVAVGLVLNGGTFFYVRGLRRAERSRARQAYVAQLAATQAALRTVDVGLAQITLDKAPEHLREWEWHHLRMRLDESSRVLWESGERLLTMVQSPDGSCVAVSTDRRIVLVGTAGEGAPVEVDRVGSQLWMTWSPTGRKLLVGDWSGRLRIVELSGAEPSVNSRDMGAPVRGVAFGPRGERVAAAVRDGSIHVLTADLSEELAVLRGHSGNVDGLAFTPGGAVLLSASWDGTVRSWTLADGTSRVLFDAGDSLRALALSPRGDRWAVGSMGGPAITGALEGEARSLSLVGHRDTVGAMAFDPSGELLVTASEDGSLRLWNAAEGTLIDVLHGHRSLVTGVAFHPDGRRLVSVSPGGQVLEWDLRGPRGDAWLIGHHADIAGLAFTPDGRQLVSGAGDTTARVWDVVTGRQRRLLEGPRGSVMTTSVTPDGERVLAGCSDGSLWSWELERGRVLLSLEGDASIPVAVAPLEDGERALVVRRDGRLQELWIASGRILERARIDGPELSSFARDPGGERVAVGDLAGRIVLLDASTLEIQREVEGHQGVVSGLAFAPDGKRLASVGFDRTLRLWDVEGGVPAAWETVATAEGTAANLYPSSVTFHPSGRRLVTSARGGFLRIWDAQTGGRLLAMRGHEPWANIVRFDPTGRHLASGGSFGGLRLWNSGPGPSHRPLSGADSLAQGYAQRVERWIAELGGPRAVIEHLQDDPDLGERERDELLALAGERLGSAEWMLSEARRTAAQPGLDQAEYLRASRIGFANYRRLSGDEAALAVSGMNQYRRGALDSARTHLELAVQEREVARDPLAVAMLAMSLARLGDVESAHGHLARAEALPGAAEWEALLVEARGVVAAAQRGGDDPGDQR